MKFLISPISVAMFWSLLLILPSPQCAADDLDGSFEKRQRLDLATRAKLEAIDATRLLMAKQALEAGPDDGLEGVAQRSLLWKSRKMTVCFFDGELDKKTEVSTLIQRWTDGTGIRFDFGEITNPRQCFADQPSDVRVSFEGAASYSEVGTKALFIPRDMATLKLGGMGGSQPLSQSQRGRVLHEFGHALGFEHEHQSPSGGCDAELNWAYLYAKYGSKSLVDKNMRSFLGTGNITGIYASSFDPLSVMIYALPREAFVDAENSACYVADRSSLLSTTDLATVRLMYPAQEAGIAP